MLNSTSGQVSVRMGDRLQAVKPCQYLASHLCQLSLPSLLLLVWHVPLGVRSAKRRHQSPEWTILSHSYRLIQ